MRLAMVTKILLFFALPAFAESPVLRGGNGEFKEYLDDPVTCAPNDPSCAINISPRDQTFDTSPAGSIKDESPICVVDPCACAECPEEGLDRVFETPNQLLFKDRLESPICFIDPCACGYCPDESPVDESNGLLPLRLNSIDESSPPITPYVDSEVTVLGRLEIEDLYSGWEYVDTEINVCPDQRVRPWEMHREAYFSRVASLECTNKVAELQTFEDSMRGMLNIQDLSNPQVRGQLKRDAIEVYTSYTKSCLIRLDDVAIRENRYRNEDPSKSNVLQFAFTTGQVGTLFDSVGRITSIRGQNWCSASIVQNKQGNAFLLTAMHCLGLTATLDQSSKILSQVYPSLIFQNYSGDEFNVSVDSSVENIPYQFNSQDVALIPIRDTNLVFDEPVGLPLSSEELVPWEPFMIIGENPYLFALERLETLAARIPLKNSMSITLTPHCRFRNHVGPELRYLCQTARGLSGSPIVVNRNGKLSVVGVHTGALSNEQRGPFKCGAEGGSGGINRGIALIDR